jgi:hypothetical protein
MGQGSEDPAVISLMEIVAFFAREFETDRRAKFGSQN